VRVSSRNGIIPVVWFLMSLSLPLRTVGQETTAFRQNRPEAAFTRAQAIEYALAHSPLFAAARERIAAAQGSLQSVGALPPPEVSFGPSIGGETGTPILTQVFEISGRRGARAGAARGELTATRRETDAARLDLIRDVSRAYYDLAQAQQGLTLFTEIAGIVRRTRDSVKKQADVGELPAQDLVKAETELARAESDVVRARTEVETRRIALNATMGRPTESPVETSELLSFAPVAADQAAVIAQAVSRRPELAAAEARVVAAQQNVRLQRADYRPDLGVSLLQNTNVSSRDFLSPRATGVGISLVFPLFDTGRIRGRVRQAEAIVREQERLRNQARIIVLREVGDAYVRVKATETLVTRYQQDILPRAQDLLNKAQYGYERGGSTLLEYLEAQRTYRNTRSEYLAILGDNARARAELERATGQEAQPSQTDSERNRK
jgi:cobalt-zinc-cadmium efflux system outer membrane protein